MYVRLQPETALPMASFYPLPRQRGAGGLRGIDSAEKAGWRLSGASLLVQQPTG
jgi:hypothetical protein